jgi:predicted nucleotidyltransferase
MGTILGENLSSALFGKTRRTILALLFTHPERSFYVREIVQASKSGVGAVQRELSRLAETGLITREEVGNQVHYQANPDCPIFEEIRSLMVKTAGVAEVLRDALRPVGERINLAFVYGSQASGEAGPESDIDLMVVGEVDELALHRAVGEAEDRTGRTVNYTLYSPGEFSRRRREKGGFLERVLNGEKILIKGEENDV